MNDYYDRELMLNIMIWAIRPNDPQGILTTVFESFKKLLRSDMTGGELTPRVILDDLVRLPYKVAMEDPTQRDEFVKFVKGLNPQFIEYLSEDVKDLLKDYEVDY